jgi:hypothetical protein
MSAVIPPGVRLAHEIAEKLQLAATKKAESFRAERLFKRTRQQVFLMTEGKTVGERDAKTDVHPTVTEAEDKWISAETAHILARAEADGLSARFEAWRSTEASNRAEMQLR